MIRQILNAPVPTLGTVADTIGPLYAVRVTLPNRAAASSGVAPDAVWLTVLRPDGAAEAPIYIDPTATGWIRFGRKVAGIRLNATGPNATMVNVWYTTDPADRTAEVVDGARPWRQVYGGVVVTAGGALDTGIIFVGEAERLYLVAYNNSGATTRDLRIYLHDHDGNDLTPGGYIAAITGHPVLSTRACFMAPESSTATSTTAVVVPVPPRIRVFVPAAGADSYTLSYIFAR